MANRPKLTHVKAAAGTLRKDRRKDLAPTPGSGAPNPPTWLPAEAVTVWRRLSDQLLARGTLTVADGPALELLVTTYVEFEKLEEQVGRDGYTYLPAGSKAGATPKAGPATSMLRSARKQLRMMLLEFGLTPAARSNV